MVVAETYVVTDDDYVHAPEGQKALQVALTDEESNALKRALVKYRNAAAEREGVA